MTKDTDQEIGLGKAKTRAEAIERGDKHYFNGEACPQGHIGMRFTKSGGCVECGRAASRKYREENIEEVTLKTIKWRNENKDHVSAYNKRKREENPDKIKENWMAWHEKNKEAYNAKRREKRAENPTPHNDRARKWKEDNPEKYKESYTKSYTEKRLTPKGKLEHCMSSGVRRGIIKGSKSARKTFDILGYSVSDLMSHLEKKFLIGMNWDNYGEWHIDHIVPLSAHNYETPDDLDFKRAWSLANLQPLWEADNLSKSDKLSSPFQPSLLLHAANDNQPQTANATSKNSAG